MNLRAAIKLEGRALRVPDYSRALIGDSRSSSLQGGRRGESAFTMAEIAIALGVIAIALIAIIGILPSGLQVQRDNREETIINQDSRLLLQAIKTGGRDDTSDLASFFELIDGNPPPPGFNTFQAVQLLSDSSRSHTNVIRAISGGIASRGSEVGFRYQLVTEVISPLDRQLFGGAGDFVLPQADVSLTNQLFDVRLRFSWPVLPNGQLASEVNRYVARCLVSGWHTNGLIYAQEYRQPKP
jgi:type II secretory pathway pseudopilin PulG